jgi:hypothetical protein
MATSASVFRGDFFRVISDGEKIVLLRDGREKRECIMLTGSLLSHFNININQPTQEFRNHNGGVMHIVGLRDCTVDITLKGGEVKYVDHPLVMGVDIFDRLSITDYLDIINEKIKGRL